MTEEIKTEVNVETKECNCICKSQAVKNILTVATGSFIGVFCALSLFAALHKPPMPVPCPFKAPMRPPVMQPHHHFDRHAGYMHGKRDFDKKFRHHRHGEKPPVKMPPKSDK